MMLPWLLATKMRAAGERFDPGIGEPFRRGRERADIGGGDQARQIGMRDGAEQADAIREPEPDDQRIEPAAVGAVARDQQRRSEARRVGKGGVSTCRSRWSRYN